MRKALWLPVGGVLLLSGWSLWAAMAGSAQPAKDLRPVVVVSLASYNKTLDNVAALGKVSGRSELAGELIIILKLAAIQQGLTGPDKTRPWGAVVQTDGQGLIGCAFVPSADLASLASLAEPLVGKAESLGGGVYKLRSRAKPVYLKQKDGWAVFAYSPEALDALPPDPAALLAGLNTQYDVAVRVHAANVPPKHREQFVEWLKNRIGPYSAQGRHEPDHIYALRKQFGQKVFQPAMAAVDDADTVTLGWNLDAAAQKTCVEVGVTVKEGTQTDRALAGLHDVKSQFRGFRLPDAVLMGNWAGQLPTQKAAALTALTELLRVGAVDRIEREGSRVDEGRQFVADLAALTVETINSGRIDGGMAVVLKPDALTLAAGGYVADGDKLTKTLKLIAKVASEERPEVAGWIRLDAEECRSVRLHTLSVPLPAQVNDRARIVSLIGEKLEMAVGIGPQSAYVAVGREPLKVLKQVIEQSAAEGAQDVPPVELSLSAGGAAKFIAATARQEKVRALAGLLAAALEPSAGRDHVRFTAGAIPHGVKYRLEVEEGILKLTGRLTAMITGEESK